MDWDRAFRKSAKAYFEDKGLKEYDASLEAPRKYTKDYLDGLNEQETPKKDIKKLKDIEGLDIEDKPKRNKNRT